MKIGSLFEWRCDTCHQRVEPFDDETEPGAEELCPFCEGGTLILREVEEF